MPVQTVSEVIPEDSVTATTARSHHSGNVMNIAAGSVALGAWTWFAFFRHLHALAGSLAACSVALAFAFCCIGVERTLTRHMEAAKAADLKQQIYRCSLATMGLILFMPEYLGRVHPPMLRSILLLTTFLCLWIALIAICVSSRRVVPKRTVKSRSASALAFSGLALLFTIATLLAIRKYQVFGYVGQDLAYFTQILYTTSHGHLFWGNLLQDLLYSRPVTTDFAGHNSPIMFLFVPVFASLPSPLTLLVMRNLVLFACALPVYRIAHLRVGKNAAYLWAGALLLTPAFLLQSTFDFYPLSFVALPLLYTVSFYLERRFVAFSVALVLTLFVREDLVFFALGVAIIALLEKRSARWVLFPGAGAVIWGILSFLILIPAALHGAHFVTDACFSHLGPSTRQMLHNVVLHPGRTILVHGNQVYLKTLFTPSGLILSAGSAFSVLALPYVAINLLAGAGPCITTVISAQYSIIPATLLFTGTLLAGTRHRLQLLARLGRLNLPEPAAAPLVLIALSIGSLIFAVGETQAKELQRPSWQSEAQTVLSLIPPGSSVATPRYMLPHLASRNCLYQAHRLAEYHHARYEYLILDKDWTHINAAPAYQLEYQKLLQSSQLNPALTPIYSTTGFVVYRNLSPHKSNCATDLAPQESR